jgi:NADPH2:quinone reductase
VTAALGLYRALGLPPPWAPRPLPGPFLIYGGSTAVGAFAIKLAKAANLHPIIAVAGSGLDFVSSLLDPGAGDMVLDYRNGPEQLQRDIANALTASRAQAVYAAFDAVSEHSSWDVCLPFLIADTLVATVLPYPETAHLPGGTTQAQLVMVGDVHDVFGEKPGGREFGYVMMRAFVRGLQEGWLSGHPYEVVPGGLDGVQNGLERLSKGQVSARKLVYRIEETISLSTTS